MHDQLLLAHIMGETATIDTNGSGQHECDDRRAVQQVVVVPVVRSGTDDDHVLAVGRFGVGTPLACISQQGVTVNARDPLLPCWRVGSILIVVRIRIGT